MSTVAITDLEPGTQPTSTAVNATITSWNTATAAGAIGADNVRVEGVDRRTMSAAGHVVATEEIGSNTIVSSALTSGAVTNTSGSYVVVTCGATNLETNDMTIASTSKVIIHASVFASGDRKVGAPTGLIQLAIQRSSDGGATWSTLTGTEQNFRYRVQPALYLVDPGGANFVPGIKASVTWGVANTVTTGTWRYRVGYQTAAASAEFLNGVIFPEILGC